MRVWQSSQRLSGFRSILVDVDAGAEVHYALERGVRLAQATGARLRIVTVVPPLGIGSSWPGPDDYHDYRHRRARLEGLATSVRGVAVDCNLFVGRVAPALVDEVVRSGHDLLLRLHLRDAIPWAPKEFRDVNAQLFRNCPCPVWAVGYGAVPTQPHIVAAIRISSAQGDDDARNASILDVAARIATSENGLLTLFHASTAFSEEKVRGQATEEDFARYLEATRRRAKSELLKLATSACVRVPHLRIEVRRGGPEQTISEFIVGSGADLLVIGAGGTRGIRTRMFGSLAERVLRRVPCSVIAVKR